MRALVTGSNGFIGRNLCSQLQNESIEVLRFDRSNHVKDLYDLALEADFVFHIAGINRPQNDSEFDKGNRQLTGDVIKAIENSGRKIPLLLTSSIQAGRDNPYGESKKAAETEVFDWAKRTRNKAYIYRLPNVFGKWSRPEYNSVVATFCHRISRDINIKIDDSSAAMTLVYIDDVVRDFIGCLNGKVRPSKDGYCYISKEFNITVGELAKKLFEFKDSRESLVIPNLNDVFDRYLYATYLSLFEEKGFDYDLDIKSDDRGWLSEFIKSKEFGQIFISKTKPGIMRGNHWHNTKVEKFLVVDGKAEINFRRIGDNKVLRYRVSGDKAKVVDIPPGYVHSIKNIGTNDLITIFWADEIFNPDSPDTYYEEV